MRTVSRVLAGLAAGAAVALAAAPAAPAQTTSAQPPHPAIFLKPNTGPAGSVFTIGWSDFRPACRYIDFTWAGTFLARSPGGPEPTGSVTTTVPASAKPGTYTITASVPIGNCTKLTASATFTVPGNPTTPVTSDPPVTTSVSQPPVTNPPVTGRPSTSKPPVTSSTPPTTDTPPPTGDPSSSIVDTPVSTGSGGDLVLDHPSIGPGDPLSASGKGCVPGSSVTLTSGRDQVGRAVAQTDGTFSAPVQFTRIEAGRHLVTASCGIVLTGLVDQVVTSSTGSNSGTMIVLVFFVLAGVAVIRFR
ncbi:hypothetical protein [Actinocrispum wychmicini]|uniref:Ig-like domain-containing protein n=1 Tax=Actinocrispum wychmicini TaxID=1213861 RepID=A0A4R2JA10_9PSEU|nr:hypothetical protein [Actinocrispum wychmicini]TCO55107.1 hypothetical protein EV192_108395 [Actinocrispum wychmicini]